ncbi:50S ribosomal protein L9 [bacterium]|nr:50S ribosomal protein L9 [bacterium]
MEIILTKDVQNIGEAGDIVKVKDGYARNFLLPQNLATKATPGAIANREKNLARIKAKQEKLHQEALAIQEKLSAVEALEIAAKAGESGKLFGTITTKRLAEEILAKTGIEIDRKEITLNAPLNRLGKFVMTIKLTSKVKAEMNVNVIASEIIKEEIITEEDAKEEKAE